MSNLKIKTLILITIFSSFGASAAPAGNETRQGPQLVFASAIEVSPRSAITLFDIVETRGASAELIETLKSKTVEHKSNEITRDDLVRALRGISAHFLLPQEIKLIRSKQNVSRMELERKIKNQLLARCRDCEYQIQVQSVPHMVNANWDLELNIDLSKETVMIPITDENQKGSQWVVVEIRKYAEIPISSRNIASQTSIEPAMFKMEKRILRSTQDVVTTAEELDGVQTTRAMTSGQAFSKRDLKKEQIIKKNQIVKAQVERDGYQIFITAVAEDSGALGDLIRVKNLDSQKTIAAEIVGRGVVKID
jgi:flagellar basal body P-ring formation protein FlgA